MLKVKLYYGMGLLNMYALRLAQNLVLGIKTNIPNTVSVLGILFQDHDGIFY
jgi:hypothetical protein